MSILPSPPRIPQSPDPSHSHSYSRQLDNYMKSIMASSWRVLEQSPPTLREILGAYEAGGGGDREMLLAMLNAKSSEDQRLANYAQLQRTMLDLYKLPQSQTGPPTLHASDGHHSQAYAHGHQFPSPPTSYNHSPNATVSQQLHHDHVYYGRQRTNSSSSFTDIGRDRSALPSSSSQQTRKRRRMSRSPPPHLRTRASPSQEAMPAHPHDLPPSPYSSASSAQSSAGSPRSRESMAINSLLLKSSSHEDDTPKGNTSSERSTTVASQRER